MSFLFTFIRGTSHQLKTFYTSEFNHKRRSGKMTVTTWLKVVERLFTFLSFGASKLEVTPSIALVKKKPLGESFISHLRTDRRVQNSTTACYIQSLVTTSNFLGADQRYGGFLGDSVSSDLRALRRQLERAKAFTTSMPDVRLLWPQYQELVRSLHCQYQDAPAANKARLHMDFTMLLLFAVNPGRGLEDSSLADGNARRRADSVKRLARRRQCSSHLRQRPSLVG